MTSLAERLTNFAYSTPIYRLTLMGPNPKGLHIIPSGPWAGDAGRGAKILAGSISHAGTSIDTAKLSWKKLDNLPTHAYDFLHSFEWLRDLHALGGAPARHQARKLIGQWLDECGQWCRDSWEPTTIASRMCAWLNHYSFFGASADEDFHNKTLESLCRQYRHLCRTHRSGTTYADRILALKGLIYGAATLPGYEDRLSDYAGMMEKELNAQLLADGFHISRSPQEQFHILRNLIEVRALFTQTQFEAPSYLNPVIASATSALRLFIHGDGKMALFNGSSEETKESLHTVLSKTGAATPPDFLKQAGFERLEANNTLIIFDSGAPVSHGGVCHAETFSFEMSVGTSRMVVNCGSSQTDDEDWLLAQRATAAHSTATINNQNSSAMFADGSVGRRPKAIALKREDVDGQSWIEASHDGYQKSCRVIHERHLYLNEEGTDVRGQDTFKGARGKSYAIRFHLHPSVQITPLQGRKSVLLKLSNGYMWKFRVQDGSIDIEDSVYMGGVGDMKKTKQLVLNGQTQVGDTTVKWAFQEEARK